MWVPSEVRYIQRRAADYDSRIVTIVGETKTLALDDPLARSSLDSLSTPSGPCGDCHGIVHSAVRRANFISPHWVSRPRTPRFFQQV
jgi:hypothetical protein